MNKSAHISMARSAAIIIASKIFSLIKMSFAIGTFWTAFSLRTMLTPLVGAFGGMMGVGMLCASSVAHALFFKKALTLSFLAYSGIPSLLASAYWATESRAIRAAIPAACIALFVLHPQGMMAAPYALYWLIPIAVAYRNTSSIFLTSLGSTFTAHAAGSVLWLYSTGMQASYWYGLLPLVPAERLALAAGMAVSHMLFTHFLSYSSGFIVRYARAHQ